MRTWQSIPLRRTRTILIALALLLTTAMPVFAAAPSNDDIANASPISGLPFADAQNTADATSAADDPVPDCVNTSATVWYALTLAADNRSRLLEQAQIVSQYAICVCVCFSATQNPQNTM